ncbi:MAG: hypothetical protein CVT77_15060 [Alphaproteobacteria bacterium HGW-Alphaproteobacteria-16]|nr:MAG: hypothetical protein CVT77_15060 [Alphaproteobacteria bacterium HGW-Alphaproteobacteria-16]
MQLDFFTLYVVIVTLSASLCAIWGTLAWQYAGFAPARTWFLAALTSAAGGGLMPFQSGIYAPLVAAAANGLIVLAFWLFYTGLRQLHGARTGIAVPLGASAVSVALTLALFHNVEFTALHYALGQMAPMFAMLHFLFSGRHRSAGSVVAGGGLLLGLIGHGVVVGMNLVILSWIGPTPDWSAAAALTMVCVIFSGLLLNFGFAVLTIDHLRGEIEDIANRDALTGALNRRGFAARIATKAMRGAKAHGILLIDLDGFKAVNDRFGHAAGDECLVHLVRVVTAQLRANDIVTRLGGDEFCVVLWNASVEDCTRRASGIQAALQDSPLLFQRQSLRVRCSIGTSIWDVASGMSAMEAIAHADEAMYARKARRKPVPVEAVHG